MDGEQMYVAEKPVLVVVIAGHEVEADYLWLALTALKEEQEHLDESGWSYGTWNVDDDISTLLQLAGYAKIGIRRYIYPTPEFDALYNAVQEAMSEYTELRPSHLWALTKEQPAPPRTGER